MNKQISKYFFPTNINYKKEKKKQASTASVEQEKAYTIIIIKIIHNLSKQFNLIKSFHFYSKKYKKKLFYFKL